MHRQFARAHYYKSLPQDENGTDDGRLNVQLDEPESRCRSIQRRLGSVLPDSESEKFSMVIGLVIVINALVLGLETDLGAHHFILFEHFFAVVFTFEMFLRINQLGLCEYISRVSNLFDATLVLSGDFDLYCSRFFVAESARNGGGAKLLKLLRLFRVMRIVRLFKMFHELQIIMEAFLKALHTVMWVGLLTIILNYICAVFLTQTIGHNAELWGEKESLILQWFGSIGYSMRTLFIIITLAEWDQIALVVSEHVDGFLVFVCAIAYITLTAFTMVSLITGIISEELVGAQKEDEVHKLEQIEKNKAELIGNVRTLLEEFDADKSGALSYEEVKTALDSEDLRLMDRMQALDIAMEKEELLTLIDRLKEHHVEDGADEETEIPIDDIAQSLKHLSGSATSSSVWDIKMLILGLQKDFARTNTRVENIMDELGMVHAKTTSNHTESHDKLDKASMYISEMHKLLQADTSGMDKKLDDLASRMDRLERLHLDSMNKNNRHLEDRMAKVEEIMHLLCNHIVGGTLPLQQGGNVAVDANLHVEAQDCKPLETRHSCIQNRATDNENYEN